MGIICEAMNPKILEGEEGEIYMEELIDPTLVAISNNAREICMNLLNNAKNSMIDNFFSIKCLYHEME